jgi:NADH-quinone oxidoreductase subunit H
LSEEEQKKDKQPAKPEDKAPDAKDTAAKPAAKPAPAKPKPKPKVVIKDPVFNEAQGRLLHKDRMWPTTVWANRWSLPRYQMGALKLAILLGLLTGGALAINNFGAQAFWQIWGFVWGLLGSAAAAVGIQPETVKAVRVFHETSAWVWTPVKVLIVLHIILVAPIFFVWWERKISAHMQSRFGPMYVGGFHGWLQTIADGIKLLLKENITPSSADNWIHTLAPAVVVVPAILSFAPVYWGSAGLSAANIDVGVVYIFAMAGVSVVGIMMAGWGSGNKYSLLGGLRSAAQLVSYELPRTFSIVPVLMFAGSFNLEVISNAQAGYWVGVVPRWFVFYPVVGQIAFLIFLIASVAETNRIPFDIPEAESELVAGFHTEYSGMKFSLFFLAEYAYMFLACCLMAAFFFGGGAAPLPFLDFLPGWYWFIAKTLCLVFLFLWFRWTFPRFRVDRLMDFNWKFLLPWTFANIALAGLYLLP